MKKKTIKPTREALEREIENLKAQMLHTYKFALDDLHKLEAQIKNNKFFGSAVIIEIRDLSGNKLLRPISLRDGPSNHITDALILDVTRSIEELVMSYSLPEKSE